MRVSPLLNTLAITATTAHAAYNFIRNDCDFDVWYTSVSGSKPLLPNILKAGFTGEEGQYFDQTGTAIKITRKKDGIFTGAPVLHFAYSYIAGKEIYYGLSTVNGFDFWGHNITLGPTSGEGAETIAWNEQPGPTRTVSHLGGEIDLTLDLCAE